MQSIRWAIGVAAGLSISAFAQGPRPRMGPAGDFALIRGEFGAANKVVQGAPYSAKAVTQFTQTLSDGNHIQRTNTALVYRDSQGRVRSERTLEAIGSLAAADGGASLVSIFDPVAGKSYVLNSTSKTVHETPIHTPPAAGQRLRGPNPAATKSEDLGTQTIQGVVTQGTRTTRTIGAGLQGNERPIEIATETWYSADLQAVVMSKTSDPRFGDSTYQLTNINRAEPDPALFVVPSDYTVRERPDRRSPAQ